MAFAKFLPAQQAEVPDFITAQAQDDKMRYLAEQAKMQNTGSTIMGAADLYNTAMGEDRTPIADYMFDTEPTGQFAMEDIGYALPEATGATEGFNSAALTEALRAPAEGAGMDAMAALNTYMPTEGALMGLAPTAGFNTGATSVGALAPEALAASAPYSVMGAEALAAAAPTATMNFATTGTAAAAAAAEAAAAGTAAAPATMGASYIPAIAMALYSMFNS
jgi:hypothetical protein